MNLGVAAAIYVLSVIFAVAIGGGKGQSGTGLALGVFLGPLGALIMLFSKPSLEIQAQRAEALEAARAKARAERSEQQP